MNVVLAQLAAALCFADATTGAPVVGATVTLASGASITFVDACGPLPREWLRIHRAGYRADSLDARVLRVVAGDTVRVVLRPTASARSRTDRTAQALATQVITADAPVAGRGARLDVSSARERGASSMNGALALLPFTQWRSARGESGLSLRGARREQVVVTLDGLPLNDPATGLADVSDVPLASLGSITSAPGADPVGSGLGATGGVLALGTRAQRLLAMQLGAFGAHQVEGAIARAHGGVRWNGALSVRSARNDFGFVNDAGVEPVPEVRVNNDERRIAGSGGVLLGATQLTLLASTTDRGMVGPANVRAYDRDRARTTRWLGRMQHTWRGQVLSIGARRFDLAYRDPGQPQLDSRARAWAADAEARGTAGPGTWRLGVGGDALHASGEIRQQRLRGSASYGVDRQVGTRGHVDLAVRADAVERSGLVPSASGGARWRVFERAASRVDLIGRLAQAVRVPTLYDLYFSSPQRISVRALGPERVRFDVSAGLAAQGGTRARITAEVLAVARRTDDAIVWFPGNFGWSPANVGAEWLRGVEVRTGVARGTLAVDAWTTLYDSQLSSNGLRIPTPYVARVAGGTQARWQLGANSVSGNLRYQGARPYTAGPRNPFFELPPVWLADGALSHHRPFRRADLMLTLALDNATDAHWQSVRGFPMPGRSWTVGITLQPAQPR